MTSSIGGGSGGDIQFLFADDILADNFTAVSAPFETVPRHVQNEARHAA